RADGASRPEGPHRGELRRARLRAVQSRARSAPRGRREEVSRYTRRSVAPDHRHQLRSREAEGDGSRRRGLEAEPPRRRHGAEVVQPQEVAGKAAPSVRQPANTSSIFACSAGGAATISPPASWCDAPSKRVTRPPASSTKS